MFSHILLILICIHTLFAKNNMYVSTIFMDSNPQSFCGKIDMLKKLSEGSTNTIWTCSGISEPGLRGGRDPSWRKGPLTVADIENAARTQNPSVAEEVAEEARGRWWERMAWCVLTSFSLGAPSCELRGALPQGCCLVTATMLRLVAACSSNLPLHRRPPPESQAMTTGFRDRNWTPHDPASLSTLLHCFAGVIAHPELSLSSTLEIARRDARNVYRGAVLSYVLEFFWQRCWDLIMLILPNSRVNDMFTRW